MAPNSVVEQQNLENKVEEKSQYKTKIVWFNVFLFVLLHSYTAIGLQLIFTSAQWKTVIFSYVYGLIGSIGITGGSHRLWSHRSYKARLPMRVLLSMLASIAGQNDIFEWCRDHRAHHKFTETDADPHNIKRGYFFAHMGWLMCKKHPDVMKRGKTIDLQDLWDDPVVRFHRRYYFPMVVFFSHYVPTMIPILFWGETSWTAFCVAGITRYCLALHGAWLVNSSAHYSGNKPFDKCIEARENPIVAFIAFGEGWHNYHHVFPWDYATSELGNTLNLTKMFIDLFAFVGLAYDLKTVDPELIKSKKLKSGDGTRVEQIDVKEDEMCKAS